MAFMTAEQRRAAQAISDLSHCNPFLPERIELEKRALGAAFEERYAIWYASSEFEGENPNAESVLNRSEDLLRRARAKIPEARPTDAEVALYVDLLAYRLFYVHVDGFWELTERSLGGQAAPALRLYKRFIADALEWLEPLGVERDWRAEMTHLFACFFQLRRAFELVFRRIYGGSMPAAELRAAVWQSIFTHDMRRYRRALYDELGNVPTLITGPSGTGKEIVARAIGQSRFVPFDADTHGFAQSVTELFHPVNPSALSPTLIESELFGHRRGAFTGAQEDRIGFFEAAGRYGTIFLDEIGELDSAIQVKLLRALQDRSFQRLGEVAPRRFEGKVIAATNRDLGVEIDAGRFREDFYYRLCADQITTPTLFAQVADNPDELGALVQTVARQTVGEDEGGALAAEVMEVIETRLGLDYRWPGNFRELEQCVRNVLVRGSYAPRAAVSATGGALGPFVDAIRDQRLGADELLRRYVTWVYAHTKSYEETARRLEIDRRTVKSRLDHDWLAELEARGVG